MRLKKKEEKEKAEKALGRENYLSFWLEEAQIHTTSTAISPTEAISVVKNSFTESWIVEQINPKNKRLLPLNNTHLVGQWIETPNPYQVHSILELATLFKELCLVPKFQTVFEIMKTKEQFETALMQLAFAHKFLKSGAANVELEPATDSGRASDIQFEFKGQVYIAECYVPQSERDVWLSDFFAHSVERIGGSAQRFNKRIAISIKLKTDNLTDVMRKQIEAKSNDLIKNLDLEASYEESDFKIVVKNLTGIEEKSDEENILLDNLSKTSQWALAVGFAPTASLKPMMRGVGSQAKDRNWFFMDSPQDGTFDESVENLAVRAEPKINQIKKNSLKAKGILIIGTPLGRPDNQFSNGNFAPIINRILKKHSDVEAVILTDRARDSEKYPYYSLQFLTENPMGETLELIEKLKGTARSIVLP